MRSFDILKMIGLGGLIPRLSDFRPEQFFNFAMGDHTPGNPYGATSRFQSFQASLNDPSGLGRSSDAYTSSGAAAGYVAGGDCIEAQQIAQYLGQNFSQLQPHQIAAILSAMDNESSFDSGVLGDGGASLGLCQWQGDRRDALSAFAAAHGGNPTDWRIQVDFAMHELGILKNGQTDTLAGFGSENRAGEMLLQANNPEQAANAMSQFERFAGHNTGGSEDQERQQHARSFFNSLNNFA